MSNDALPSVHWISAAKRPLCDIPWYGTSVVLANGIFYYCCHSGVSVGNVNDHSFEEIWNGSQMKGIRKALSEQRFPPECGTNACPLFRGDQENHLLDRVNGMHRPERTGTEDPHRAMRSQLRLDLIQVKYETCSLEIGVSLISSSRFRESDLIAGVKCPDGQIRFLPNFEEYAIPSQRLGPIEGKLDLLITGVTEKPLAQGEYTLCIGLFEQQSNPNILSNCYWSWTETFRISERRGLSTSGRMQEGHRERA